MFTGTLTANLCPSTWSSPIAPPANSASGSCFTQTFPAYTGPAGAPLTGAVAFSLNGMNMCACLLRVLSSSSVLYRAAHQCAARTRALLHRAGAHARSASAHTHRCLRVCVALQ
jgi:hypothetical protein